MDYKRPIKIDESEEFFTLRVIHNEEIEIDGIKTVYPFSYISGQKTKENTSMFNHYNFETRNKFEKFVRLKSHCIRLAEQLNDNLRNFLTRYYLFKRIDTVPIITLEFSKLRDELSKSLKSDAKLRSVFKYDVDKKKYTKTFADFITDRNIYTHGDLHLRIEDGAMIIFYKENAGHLACEINDNIIQSFLDTQKWLNSFINKFWELANAGQL